MRTSRIAGRRGWRKSVSAVLIAATAIGVGAFVGPRAADASFVVRIPEVKYRTGTPALARHGDGRLEMFVTDGDDNIWHRSQTAAGQSTWTGWSQMDGQLRSIAAETNVDGRMELVGINSEGRVWHRWQQAGGWSPWSVDLGDRPMASVAMARNGDGRLEVFATDGEDRIWHRWQTAAGGPQGWSGWAQFDGLLRSVAAETNVDGRVELFGINAEGRMYHRWQQPGGWSAWSHSLDGFKTTLAVARNDNANGRLEVYATNGNDEIVHRWQQAAGTDSWTPWAGVDGRLRSMAADTNADGSVAVVGVNAQGLAYQRRYDQPGNSWSHLPGPLKPFFGIATPNPVYGENLSHFLTGVTTPNAVVRIAPYVDLDLSGLADILIASGVRIQGFRSADSPRGPRLYTTTNPYSLFLIGNDYDLTSADNVKISGIRLDGGLLDPADAVGRTSAHGIIIGSSVGVEISDSELYQWSGAAIAVVDKQGRMNRDNAHASVWIHDNAIYLNQHPSDGIGGAGYGVVMGEGAYALIEQNMFSKNTHSITASGDTGGYLAYRNLVLAPGISRVSGPSYGHFFDVHGAGCNYACGRAGEYFDIRWNTFVDNREYAVKLRGTPDIGMDVAANAFAQKKGKAYAQTETGLRNWANLFDVHYFGETGHFRCDFDRDGVADRWTTSGQTMWYESSARSQANYIHWVYVMQTEKRAGAMNSTDLAGFIADGRCS